MLVDVFRVRDHGWILPRFRSAFLPPQRGVLHVGERRDNVLNRHVRYACLLDPLTMTPLPSGPELIDVQLVSVDRERLTFTGFERLDDVRDMNERDYAQSWICLVVPSGDPDAPRSSLVQ